MKYALYISILSKTSLTWEITSFTSSGIILCIVFFWFGWSLKFCFLFVKFTAKLCSISDPFLNNFILKLLTSTFKFIYDGLPPDLKTVLIFFFQPFLFFCWVVVFWAFGMILLDIFVPKKEDFIWVNSGYPSFTVWN